jgi:hypothetical protein
VTVSFVPKNIEGSIRRSTTSSGWHACSKRSLLIRASVRPFSKMKTGRPRRPHLSKRAPNVNRDKRVLSPTSCGRRAPYPSPIALPWVHVFSAKRRFWPRPKRPQRQRIGANLRYLNWLRSSPNLPRCFSRGKSAFPVSPPWIRWLAGRSSANRTQPLRVSRFAFNRGARALSSVWVCQGYSTGRPQVQSAGSSEGGFRDVSQWLPSEA